MENLEMYGKENFKIKKGYRNGVTFGTAKYFLNYYLNLSNKLNKLLCSIHRCFRTNAGDIDQNFFAGKLLQMRVTPAQCG